jgi:hypothetical protein
MSEIDFDDMDEETKEKLAAHPEVRKMLEYDDSGILAFADSLEDSRIFDGDGFGDENLTETGELFTEQVAERCGRVTAATVRKVLAGIQNEAESVQ